MWKEANLHSFLLSALDRVSGQIHPMTALPLEKNLMYTSRRSSSPRSFLDVSNKRYEKY
jgi:hypothetical protein